MSEHEVRASDAIWSNPSAGRPGDPSTDEPRAPDVAASPSDPGAADRGVTEGSATEPSPVAEHVASAGWLAAAPGAPATSGGPTASVESASGRRVRRRPAGVQVAIAVVAVMAGAGLFLSGFVLGRHEATTPGTPGSEAAAFVPFWDTYDAITQQYAGGEVDSKQVIEGAIKGMIDSLGDPFSQYLSSEDYKKSLQGIAGQFEGIGANIAARKVGSGDQCTPLGTDCQMVVTSPVPGSPADQAGILAGDVITAIDGVSVTGSTLDDAVAKVRGPKGSTVTLTVLRKSATAIQVPIVRDVITESAIVSRALANGAVGYIRITTFSDSSASDFVTALSSDVKAGQRKFVLDLRGNPGGLVLAAQTIASQFIGSGPIYWQEDAQGNELATMANPNGVATDPSIQVEVLIDKGSASASEIVAGALQDTKRGTLVGQTSYGKGTIQEWEPLPNDTGGFRLTIAKWLTPDKRWIHHVGLTPDVAVDVPQSTPPDQDLVLDKALQLLGVSTADAWQLAA